MTPTTLQALGDILLHPRGIAIIGASPEPHRIGGQPIRALKEFGYAGRVYPVNPKYDEVQGLPCCRDIASVPKPCDIALICVPASAVAQSIRECGHVGIPAAVVLSAGFKEIGEAGQALQADLDAAIAESGVRVIGPNCQGMLSPAEHVYCGFGAPFMYSHALTGSIALVTQSGGFGYAVMGLSEAEGTGFNHVISTGNEADVTALDLMELLLAHEKTRIVATYIEGVKDGRRLTALGHQALSVNKPILVWKVGNSETGKIAAASHTANLSAGVEMYRTAFAQGGYVELSDVYDLVDMANAFSSPHRPQGKRVAVISISGGAGVLLADVCDGLGLSLPAMSEETLVQLRGLLPGFSSLLNPIDVTAQIFNDFSVFNKVVSAVGADPGIDQLIVVMASVEGANALKLATELADIHGRLNKPIFVVSSAPAARAKDAREKFREAAIPVYPTPSRAAKGMAAVTEFERKRVAHMARATATVTRAFQKPTITMPDASCTSLSERESKAILAAYGIPVVQEVFLTMDRAVAGDYSGIAFPVVAKLDSPDLPHKTEAGAVRVGLQNAPALKTAIDDMVQSAKAYKPDARIAGVSVQQMATGTEVIVGTVNDPYFGPTVVFGLGGIFTELLKDISMRFAPVSIEDARSMVTEIKASKLLTGYRGGLPVDLDRIAEIIHRVSWLAHDHQDRIAEIDINPIFVRPPGQESLAADGLIVLKPMEKAL